MYAISSATFCGRTHAIFVSADRLRPEAEGALRRATAAGVQADIRMQQVTDEIFLDLQVALVNVGHPRKRIHVRESSRARGCG